MPTCRLPVVSGLLKYTEYVDVEKPSLLWNEWTRRRTALRGQPLTLKTLSVNINEGIYDWSFYSEYVQETPQSIQNIPKAKGLHKWLLKHTSLESIYVQVILFPTHSKHNIYLVHSTQSLYVAWIV